LKSRKIIPPVLGNFKGLVFKTTQTMNIPSGLNKIVHLKIYCQVVPVKK